MLADRIRMTLGKSRKLIDRAELNLVTRISSVTRGNGGRKLVRMDDGTLVTIAHESTGSLLYKSVNNGLTWDLLKNIGYDATDTAIVAKDSNIYVLYTYGYGTYMRAYSKEGILVNSTTIDSGQREVTRCSLALNKENNELHACWSSKNATHPDTFNIRYCRGNIRSDGTVSWDSLEPLTTINNSGVDGQTSSTIVLLNGNPIIIFNYDSASTNQYGIGGYLYNGTNWVLVSGSILGIYHAKDYRQSSPSACVDRDGVIHICWYGRNAEATVTTVMYKKSIDGGRKWSVPERVVPSGSATDRPSIAVNKKGEVFIALVRGGIYVDIYKRINETVWNREISYSFANYPRLIDDNNIEFVYPLTVFNTLEYNTNYKDSVVFTGKWHE